MAKKKIPESALAGHQVELFFANIGVEMQRFKEAQPHLADFFDRIEVHLARRMTHAHEKNGFLSLKDVETSINRFCKDWIKKSGQSQTAIISIKTLEENITGWMSRSFKEINRNVTRERPPGLDHGDNGIDGNGHGGNGRGGNGRGRI